jgi:prepilin-type N-terminal cleavage/methylation domain-containing protein
MTRIPRPAYTLIELLVVLAIVALIVGLLLSAIQKVREASARTNNMANLRQIGIAADNFHTTHGRLPGNGTYSDVVPVPSSNSDTPPAVFPAYPEPGKQASAAEPTDGSFFYQLLPYLEQENLYRSPAAALAAPTAVKVMLDPGRGRAGSMPATSPNGANLPVTDYCVNLLALYGRGYAGRGSDALAAALDTLPAPFAQGTAATAGLYASNRRGAGNGQDADELRAGTMKYFGIKDGRSNTVLASEKAMPYADYNEPGDRSFLLRETGGLGNYTGGIPLPPSTSPTAPSALASTARNTFFTTYYRDPGGPSGPRASGPTIRLGVPPFMRMTNSNVSPVRMRSVPDGAVPDGLYPKMLADGGRPFNAFGSPYSAGVHVLMCDGSVRMMTYRWLNDDFPKSIDLGGNPAYTGPVLRGNLGAILTPTNQEQVAFE